MFIAITLRTIDVLGLGGNGNYEFTVQQDNWEYVKYGAFSSCYNSIFQQSYKSFYITEDGLYEILKCIESKHYGHDNYSEEEFKNDLRNTDSLYNNCEIWAIKLNKSIEDGNSIVKDMLITNIGNALSISGIILLLPIAPEWVGCVVTISGGVIAGKSEYDYLKGFKSKLEREALIDALYKGKGCICITDYKSNNYGYDQFGNISEEQHDTRIFDPWMEQHYIYKFINGERCEIEEMKIYEIIEVEEGEWVSQLIH